jgi:hypothetical protein
MDPSKSEANDMELGRRFWDKVNKTESCWLWTAGKSWNGYGQFNTKEGTKWAPGRAHRFSYESVNGAIPDGLGVLHLCDSPACVRPSHLFLGTQADNMRDMAEKGRAVRGEAHPRAKLTVEKVLGIRAGHKHGATGAALASEYGVNASCISKVIAGRLWKHIPAEETQ